MKTLKKRVLTRFGIVLFAVAMAFLFTACPEPEPEDTPPEIPSGLQGKTFTHKSGDKITFTKDSVILKSSDGNQETHKLVDASTNSAGYNILFFKDKQSQDNVITYNNDNKISMVRFTLITQTNDWEEGDKPVLEEYEYQLDHNTSSFEYREFYRIVAYNGDGGDIIIPSYYKGLPIVGIYRRCFENKNITSVVLPQNMNSISNYGIHGGIGDNAFASNPNLTSVTISASIGIGLNTFDGDFYYVYNPNNVDDGGIAGTYTRAPGGNEWTKIK